MYCRFCGTEIENDAKFCSSCGKSQTVSQKPAVNILPSVLCYVIGGVFILLGILPYFLRGSVSEYNDFLIDFYREHFADSITPFTTFSNIFESFFSISSSVLSILVGLLLLKKASNITVPLIICAVMHMFSIVRSVAVYTIIYCFPKIALSLYINDERFIKSGIEVIREHPDIIYFSRDAAICRGVISVLVIALAIVMLFVKKYLITKNKKISSAGSVAMILSLALMSNIGVAVAASLGGNFYGQSYAMAFSVAESTFYRYFSTTSIFLFFAVICIAVIFTGVKRWILSIPTVSVILILGIAAFLLSAFFVITLGTPVEVLELSVYRLKGMIVGYVAVLIAVFYWFGSVSKNRIPMWLQIALPASLPVIYISAEIVANLVMCLNLGFSLGIILISLITLPVSLFVCKKRKSPVNLSK